MNKAQFAHRSLDKRFRKSIWNNFIGALKQYQLISKGDKIAVCISGGKDSMLLAVLMDHLKRFSEIDFDLAFLCMDPGYTKENREKIENNALALDVELNFFETNIFNVVDNTSAGSPCYLCARMRRGYLYKFAKELGCNKIALGHHFDDAIETTLMSMLYTGEVRTMMPKLKSTNFEGMELIRPLYKVKENDIILWARYNDMQFLNCACKVSEKNEISCDGSKRQVVKNLIKELKGDNENIDINIFKSMHNVNLGTVIGYRNSSGEDNKMFTDNY